MIPNPKDPLAPPVSVKSQMFLGEGSSSQYSVVPRRLRDAIKARGLQNFIEELPCAGLYDYRLFAESLGRGLFLDELCLQFESFCEHQRNIDEGLSAILLYRLLFPHVRENKP